MKPGKYMYNRKDSKGRVLRKGEGEQADGRYYYQYYDLSKRRRKIYANTLKELREKIDAITVYTIQGIDIHAGSRITLNECFDKYMKVSTHLKRGSRNRYYFSYNKYIRDSIGKLPVGKIKYSTIKEFFCH